MARIVLGSGDLYVSEYINDTIPSVEDILKTERLPNSTFSRNNQSIFLINI